MTKLIKINAAEYGLEETKAKEISEMFKPMLDKMVELEKEYNALIKGEISEELCTQAKTLRLKFVKVRTGTAEIHTKLKSFYLKGGRFVDGWKNAQIMASGEIEEKLSSIERHYQILEERKITERYEKRVAELEKYEVDFIPQDLGEMETEVWNNYLSGVKLNYEAKIEAAKKAKEERIQRELESSLRTDRINETAYLQSYINDWEHLDFGKMEQKVYDGMLSDALKKELEHQEKQEQIQKDNLRLQKEAEAKERQRLVDGKIQRDKLNKIQDEKDQIAKELQDKKDAEEQAEKERIEKLESEKSKDDSVKVKDLLNDLDSLKYKYIFKSVKNQKMYSDVGILNDKVVTHIIEK